MRTLLRKYSRTGRFQKPSAATPLERHGKSHVRELTCAGNHLFGKRESDGKLLVLVKDSKTNQLLGTVGFKNQP
jgi:hypothetical protein